MSGPDPRSSAESRRPHTEPVEMSAAEKLACEWEARHDVVGRGRIGAAAPIQQYLSHARSEDARRGAHDVRPEPHRGHKTVDSPDAFLRTWVRWGED